MRIVVTGASGYVGERLLPRLAVAGPVHAVSRRRPDTLGPDQHWIEADVRDPAFISRLPASIEAVVHFAVSYRHRDFPDAADDLFLVNTASTALMLDYARRAGASWFVYGSSGSVYASTGPSQQRESSMPQPGEFFSATKLAAEVLVPQYGEYFETFIPRLFFPYGPGQQNRIIPGLISSVREGRPVTLMGNPSGLVLPPTHVDDVLDVLMAAITERWTGIVNVAHPDALSLREIATIIGDQLGREPIFEEVDGPPPPVFAPDVSRLAERFPTSGMVSFADGVATML